MKTLYYKSAFLTFCFFITLSVQSQLKTLYNISPISGFVFDTSDSSALLRKNIKIDIAVLNAFNNDSFKIFLPSQTNPRGIPVTLIKQRQSINNSSNILSWYGKIQGQAGSLVLFTNLGSAVAGYIRDKDNKIYRIQYRGNDFHQIAAINSLFIKTDKIFAPQNLIAENVIPDNEIVHSNCCDTSNEIDILVVYTTEAKDSAHGTDAIKTIIELCINISNVSYENSGINQKIILVHTDEVDYTEHAIADTYLSDLIHPSGGRLENVHNLRNTYKADIVVMVVYNMAGYEGISNIMTSNSVAFEDSAFCVVRLDHAFDHKVFTHELGHIMGAGHQCIEGTYGLYENSRGFIGNNFNTIMSVNYQFGRIEHFSNPNVFYPGPGGVLTGTSSGLCLSNNAFTLNKTIAVVNKFRCRGEVNCSLTENSWIGSTCFWLILILISLILFFLFWYLFRRNRR